MLDVMPTVCAQLFGRRTSETDVENVPLTVDAVRLTPTEISNVLDATRAGSVESGPSVATLRRRGAGAVMGIAGGTAAVAGLVINRVTHANYQNEVDQTTYESERDTEIAAMVMSLTGTALTVGGFILLVTPESGSSLALLPGPVTLVSGRF